jgi:hypothetical protein
MSQNEHFTGTSVYFVDTSSSVSKWRLRDEWANNISGNFAKFSPN